MSEIDGPGPNMEGKMTYKPAGEAKVKVFCLLCGKAIPEDQDADELPICDRCADRLDD